MQIQSCERTFRTGRKTYLKSIHMLAMIFIKYTCNSKGQKKKTCHKSNSIYRTINVMEA